MAKSKKRAKCEVRSAKLGQRAGSRIPVLAGEDSDGWAVSRGAAGLGAGKGRKGHRGHKKSIAGPRAGASGPEAASPGGAPASVRKLFGAAAASAAKKAAASAGGASRARARRLYGAAAASAARAAAKASGAGEGAASRAAAPAGRVMYLDLRVAVGEPREGVYQTRHVDVQLSPEQGRGFHRLLAGAQGAVARLRNGKLVANVGDLVRWIAEQAI